MLIKRVLRRPEHCKESPFSVKHGPWQIIGMVLPSHWTYSWVAGKSNKPKRANDETCRQLFRHGSETCEKQKDLLLDMRLNEQIGETEDVSKKHVLVNQKAELRGKLEAFERNRQNRFEPAIPLVSEAKQAAFLLAEEYQEMKRDFLKKISSNFQVADKSLAVEFKKP